VVVTLDPVTRQLYLDHAATTPVRRAALDAYVGAAALTGNAASSHTAGRAARRALEDARESIAAALGCAADEVVFTSGGTEADNIAVAGLFRSRHRADPRRRRVLISAVEHPAVQAAAVALESEGAVVVPLSVGTDGVLDAAAVGAAVLEGGGPATVALIGCMWANNEVGAVQPVGWLAGRAAEYGIPLHVDAVQAVGTLEVDAAASGAATVAVSGHKVGGPIGCGVLVVRRGTGVAPVMHGGGQEAGLRPGTVAVPLVVATAAALTEAVAARPLAAARLAGLHDALVAGIRAGVPDVMLSGPTDGSRRLPTIAHLTFTGCDSESLLVLLDRAGVAASTGSACRSGVLEPSPVLAAMGMPLQRALGAVRFSLGHTTTKADISRVVDVMPGVVATARRARAAAVRDAA